MIVEGSDRFEFGLDHHTQVSIEHYPDLEHDAMVLDPFSILSAYFGSFGPIKWKECQRNSVSI